MFLVKINNSINNYKRTIRRNKKKLNLRYECNQKLD